jgi:hypothetical protein
MAKGKGELWDFGQIIGSKLRPSLVLVLIKVDVLEK